MKELYRLENVRQRYNGRQVLSIERFIVGEGTIVGLAGHNGSGKSTLMRMLAFLESPDSGKIFYDGRGIEGPELALRREVTMLTQEPYLLKRSVAANVAYGLELRGEKNVRDKVCDSLSRVGLEPEKFMHRHWFELSGGEAQRVALAARLALNPRVLLLDEPTASLDLESTQLIHDAAVSARDKQGTTLVIVSHDHFWLEEVSDVIFRLDSGQLAG
ncbi:ATP-binding cassette domain-containing protein [Desulfovibrio sp. JC022]|uniref:ABC transporter ATP-binding protein n=1 Tax=Desulfovibrio sp. JC022 TaxID=2593642 RepID=UPI0013D71DB7|nr:ABC transporter ATP-binding protein [Desulfovibrio sp. JC022]NDV22575.1 ABC transporter ATP-binding protein [Desulfovibrio sp. JC022]